MLRAAVSMKLSSLWCSRPHVVAWVTEQIVSRTVTAFIVVLIRSCCQGIPGMFGGCGPYLIDGLFTWFHVLFYTFYCLDTCFLYLWHGCVIFVWNFDKQTSCHLKTFLKYNQGISDLLKFQRVQLKWSKEEGKPPLSHTLRSIIATQSRLTFAGLH